MCWASNQYVVLSHLEEGEHWNAMASSSLAAICFPTAQGFVWGLNKQAKNVSSRWGGNGSILFEAETHTWIFHDPPAFVWRGKQTKSVKLCEDMELLLTPKWDRGTWMGPREFPGVPHRTAISLEPGVTSFDKFPLPASMSQNWLLSFVIRTSATLGCSGL